MRLKPKIVLRHQVRNRSSRAGAKPQLIVLHSTESHNRPGNADLAAIAAWFDNPSAEASSHVVVDADGHSARLVDDDEKAWTQAAFNPWSLSIEQIGFASQGKWDERELKETARWIAHWHRKWGIPIKRGKVRGSSVVEPGVVLHSDLGAVGGGHSDPGPNYPFNRVLALAREINDQLRKEHRS